jgi:hypothetical protein
MKLLDAAPLVALSSAALLSSRTSSAFVVVVVVPTTTASSAVVTRLNAEIRPPTDKNNVLEYGWDGTTALGGAVVDSKPARLLDQIRASGETQSDACELFNANLGEFFFRSSSSSSSSFRFVFVFVSIPVREKREMMTFFGEMIVFGVVRGGGRGDAIMREMVPSCGGERGRKGGERGVVSGREHQTIAQKETEG